MKKLDYKDSYERNLPHFQPPGATFFITFRLANSLPKSELIRLHQEYNRITQALTKLENQEERYRQGYQEQIHHFGNWDKALDFSKTGPTWLNNPKIGRIVQDSLQFFDGQRYRLESYCIMPNHVHAVITPLEQPDGSPYSLSPILHSLKRFTAREANKVLAREGQFWQQETYDHFVRDEHELARIIQYVVNNPVKAGLVKNWGDWPWTFSRFEL